MALPVLGLALNLLKGKPLVEVFPDLDKQAQRDVATGLKVFMFTAAGVLALFAIVLALGLLRLIY